MINVIREGRTILKNLTKEQMEYIKADLTLDNPAYKQAVKFSRYDNVRIPPYLFYYTQKGSNLTVPKNYKIPYEYEVVEDNRIENKEVKYPKVKIELRNDQAEAFKAWRENTDRGTIVLQTGKGKSILGVYCASAMRQKTLIVVQKNDLIDGWQNDIKLVLGLEKAQIGLIKAKTFRVGEQITLTTIQTLAKLPQEKLDLLVDEFGMVICDEFHRSSAKSYEVLDKFPAKYFIGLTATDMRTDGLEKVLYWRFGDVCYRSEEKLVDEDIMPYKVILRPSKLHYNPPQEYFCGNKIVDEDTARYYMSIGKKCKRKPLDNTKLKELLRDRSFNKMVAKDILLEYLKDKSIIAFLHEKEHIRLMRDILVKMGIPESQIQMYYGDAKESDAVMKQRAESREVLITLATFSKATEGTNVKEWDTAFLVTSINNEKNVIQAVGRIRRRKAGKEECIVYDYYHPNVKGLKNHLDTRLKAYRRNKATIQGLSRPTSGLTRGYRR